MYIPKKTTECALTTEEEQLKILEIKTQINLLDQEVRSLYFQIGRKYTDYIIQNPNKPLAYMNDDIELVKSKLAQKDELENMILDLLFN